MVVKEQLIEMLEMRKDEMIAIRRHLHAHPELSFEEEETAQYIEAFYLGKDVEIETNVGNGYGIVVTIKGENPGGTIGIRADFDALPIQEETDVPFRSKNDGVMHACGHDGHTAYLLILADCLIQLKGQLYGTVKIIHQHAEETPPGGAKSIMESGKLDDVEEIFGIHLFPSGETGSISYCPGYAMAGRNYFKLHIQGVGGHGASPQNANDPIVAGAHFITAIQTIVSRRLSPFEMGVVTVGSFDGKGSFNIIKDRIEIEGDTRYMTARAAKKIEEEMHRIVRGISEQFNVICDFEFVPDYPPLYNDPDVTANVVNTLASSNDVAIKEIVKALPMSGSEDFAYYTKQIPGTFIYVGCRPEGREKVYHNHHPKFDIDEEALLVAAKAMAYIVCAKQGA